MAYVGTARVLGSDRFTLASVIQGEAGGQGLVGMQAVGAVIGNRAAINFSGYGSDAVSQATARMQFQGQNLNPSASAYAVADSVLAGNYNDPTGGALNYANPGASSASWARNLDSSNSLQIGSHYFTDNTRGVPFQPNFSSSPMNTNDPVGLTGSSGLSAPSTAGGLSGGAGYAQSNGGGNYYYNPSTGAVTPTTDANPPGTSEGFGIIDADKGVLYGGGTGPYSSGLPGGAGVPSTGFDSTGGFTALNAGGGATPSVTGLGAPGMGSPYSLQGATLDSGVSAQSITATGSAGGSMTVPQAIDTQTRGNASDTSAANKQSQQNTDSLNKTSTANTKSATDKAQSLYNSATKSGSDYFARVVFIVVGLICLAAALMLFKPVQQAAAGIAAKVPKVPV